MRFVLALARLYMQVLKEKSLVHVHVIGVSVGEPHMNMKSGAGMRCIYYVFCIVRPPPGEQGQYFTLDIHMHDMQCSGACI